MKPETTLRTLNFIKKSPSVFHAVDNLRQKLLSDGFTELKENTTWTINSGNSYFTIRNGSAIIAFTVPQKTPEGFLITASHSDSPSFKIKENPEIPGSGCTRLNVEKYGGMLMNPWFDRPLSLAGRLVTADKTGSTFTSHLVDIDRPLLMIPNLAIHMDRNINSGHEINTQQEMLPVISEAGRFSLKKLLADATDLAPEDIISHDLFLYNKEEPVFWGTDDEYIASPKLDDLECVYTTFRGFMNTYRDGSAAKSRFTTVFAVFDNEEVGSLTRQGADSTFLKDVLERIDFCLGRTREEHLAAIAGSILVSADNAHGVHPGYPGCADPVNRPVLNGGPVIKFNGNQKYTSDALSSAIFKTACSKAGVPYQIFTNNSNIAGGSTLGNISNSQVSMVSVDIGLAQWAMHSPYESAGSKDPEYMEKAITAFYSGDYRF